MKTVYLLRHGKSNWDVETSVTDQERPLARRGTKAAQRMGRFLARGGIVCPFVVSSPAVRAHETARLVIDAAGWRCRLRLAPELYGASEIDVLSCIRATPDTEETLLLVGHEPTWARVTMMLVGGGAVRFPTAGLARVTCQVDQWAEIRPGCGELIWFVTPRLVGVFKI